MERDDPGVPGGVRRGDPSLLAAAFEADTSCLLLLDDTGTIVHANAAALRGFGYAAGQLIGSPVGVVLPALASATGASFEADTELDALCRDGSTFRAHVDVATFVHGGTTYHLCTCRDTTELPGRRSLLSHLARHDRATGCLNRFGVEDHLDRLIESMPERPLAVLYLDLNGLAAVNDSYPSGVAAGIVTQAVARLRGALREQDRLARVGRHEFVAVVVLDAEVPSVGLITHRLSASLQAPLEVAAWRVPARASIGVSLYPEHARTPDKLIDRAEAAMRRAKRSAMQAHLFSVESQRWDEERDEYLERVRAAAERDEFTLYYQPQFDLVTQQTTGLEALLRWQHADKGLLSPGEFLSLLDEGGLMPTVTRWVLREAIAMNTRLAADGILDVPVAVNVGPEIFEDRGFVDLVAQALDDHGLAGDRLEVEITEAAAITDPVQVAANARALRGLGVGIAIDDFGTGFSSLKRLRIADFSKLKIDRAFVSLLPGDTRDQTVIAALVDLGARLDMQAVAEGIETEEQLRALRKLGCRYGQGFWYARPMAEDVLRVWIGGRR